jgi:ATP-dependent RNA helicase DDX35
MWAEAPVPDYLKATVATVKDIHATKGAGDVLVFLTGQDEVSVAQCCRWIA